MQKPAGIPSADSSRSVLNTAMDMALRALARVLLRNGVSFQSFTALAKRAYVDVALNDFQVEGRKPSISRVAVITGLTRKDIQQLLREEGSGEAEEGDRYHRAARVIAGWVRDADFQDRRGKPLALKPDEGDNSFAQLVRRHSGDMPARAVLDELVRVGAVEQAGDGRIHLRARVYIPTTSDADKLLILGHDVAALVTTIDHNMQHGAEDARFQRKVMYDNLPIEALPRFRALSAARAQKLLEELDRWLAAHDRDANASVTGTGRMSAGLGIYYFERPYETPQGEQQ
jgi:hypothetical protein